MNNSCSIVDIDVCSHTGELGAVHKALRENGVFNNRDAGRRCKHGCELRLHVGGESRMRSSGDRTAAWSIPGLDCDTVSGFVKFHEVAGFYEFLRGSGKLILANTV